MKYCDNVKCLALLDAECVLLITGTGTKRFCDMDCLVEDHRDEVVAIVQRINRELSEGLDEP